MVAITHEPIDQAHKTPKLHPWPLRVMHWTNAISVIVLILSGWGIYNDDAIWGWLFPEKIILGKWAGPNQLWHFAAIYFLMINGVFYLGYGLATGRLRKKLLPVKVGEVLEVARDALRLKLSHGDITHYNAVQKVLYILAILGVIAQVVSGFAIWKPVQFSWLTGLMGGFQGARILHFAGMTGLCLFLVIHVLLAVVEPKTLWAMLTGGPRVGEDEAETKA